MNRKFTLFTLVLLFLTFTRSFTQTSISIVPPDCYPGVPYTTQNANAASSMGAQPFATWKAAYDYAHTGAGSSSVTTINFAPGNYNVGPGGGGIGVSTDWGKADGIGYLLKAGLTVNGNGAVINNSANGSSSISFASINGNNVTVDGFTFVAYTGNGGDDVGVIGVKPNLTGWKIDNCNFFDTKKSGEALKIILGSSGNGQINNCNLVNNNSGNGSAMDVWGTSLSAQLTVTGSTFSCNFRNTSSGGAGGAVQVGGETGGTSDFPCTVTFNSCTFSNNYGQVGGAIVCWGASNTTFNSTNFINNHGSTSYGSIGGSQEDGGAIEIGRKATVTISDCYFKGNTTNRHGGAIDVNNTSGTAIVNITNSIFEANTATAGVAYGGAINGRTRYNITISNCLFKDNLASSSGGGGAIGTNNGSATSPYSFSISSSSFSGNNAGSGKDIFQISPNTISVTDCAFNNSLALAVSGTITNTSNTFTATFNSNYQAPPDGWTQTYYSITAGMSCPQYSQASAFCPAVNQGSIQGDAFLDANNDGIMNPGEQLANVPVYLLDGMGNVIATTTTNSSGHYIFTGLATGTYQVQFGIPSGYGSATTTTQNNGAPAFDSDVPAGTGTTFLSPLISLNTGTGMSNGDDSFAGAANYYNVTAGYMSLILPVTWSSFGIDHKNCDNIIRWTTESETNNDYFVIESSRDASRFEAVGMVDGSGDSRQHRSYEYSHNAGGGTMYYRIKQVDLDGRIGFSEILKSRNTQCQEATLIAVYPNPTSANYINVELRSETSDQDLTVNITNQVGQVVWSGTGNMVHGGQMMNLDISGLHSGVYMLSLTGKEGHRYGSAIRFVKL